MRNKSRIIAEKQATEFRAKYGLDADEALTIDRLLMKLKVLTVFRPLSSHFSGMAIKTDNDDKYILINSSQSLGKQNFTVCHELYHLYVQKEFTFRICDTGKFNSRGNRHEYYADLFAANLLMPEPAIKELIPQNELFKDKIRLETIIKIEQYLGSSRLALLYRLKTLEIISKTLLEKHRNNVRKSAVLHGKSTSLYEPDYKEDHIGDYGDLARDLFENNKISEGHYSSLLTDLGIDLSNEDNLKDV